MKLWNSGLLAKFINGKTISQAKQSCFQEKKKKKNRSTWRGFVDWHILWDIDQWHYDNGVMVNSRFM